MIKIVDLYCGIGGMRLGFEQAAKKLKIPTKCALSSEIDKYCIQTYISNFGITNFFGDLTKLNNKKIINKTLPNFDLLLAGFPCQPFSRAGKKRGFDDTRGNHFFIINEILKAKKPKAFLLENVKFLKSHNKGESLKKILNQLRKYYYVPDPAILNSKDFGLPQNRDRIFIVGFLKQKELFNFPKPSSKKTKVGNILEKYVPKKYTISNKLWIGHKKRKVRHLKNGNGFGFSLVTNHSIYTNTLSARYHKDGGEILISRGKNKNPRMLTERECARLQGFPENFKIPVSKVRAYQQFGNSVSINVIKAISINIIKYLSKNNISLKKVS